MVIDNSVVTFDYQVKDESGEEIDNSETSGPIVYIHGAKTILQRLEDTLSGLDIGGDFSVKIPPQEAYGFPQEELIKVFERSAFKHTNNLEIGMVFDIDGASEEMKVRITAIDGDQITVDANHPLAGKTLCFSGKIIAIRPASAEELSEGLLEDS